MGYDRPRERTTASVETRRAASAVIDRSAATAPQSPIQRLQQRLGNQGTQALIYRLSDKPNNETIRVAGATENARAEPLANRTRGLVGPGISSQLRDHPALHPSGQRDVARSSQTKLTISHPGDIYEQEAERVADQVMRMADPPPQIPSVSSLHGAPPVPSLQRLCAECEEELTADHNAPIAHDHAARVLRQEEAASVPEVSPSVSANIHAFQGGGSPLPAATRAFFEPRFGADFGQVRVHTGARAEESARVINAKAFTVGSDIAFAGGQYTPESHEGQRLLAHELTHVMQQSAGLAQRMLQRKEENNDTLAEIQGLPMYELLPRLTKLPMFVLLDEQAGGFVGGPRLIIAMRASKAKIDHGIVEFLANNKSGIEALPPDQAANIFSFIAEPAAGRAPSPAVTPAPAPVQSISTSGLDQKYQTAVQAADWRAAAEWLNGFSREDVQARLADLNQDQITNLHLGALDNPRVGPESQVAQLTAGPATTQPGMLPLAPAPDMTSRMSPTEKLVEAIRRGMQLKQLGQAAIDQLKALLDPEAVAILILFWIASHYNGLGEFLDAAALIFYGLQIKAILEDLWDYATIAIRAKTDADLDQAAQKFADAVLAAGVLKLLSIIEKFGAERKGTREPGKPLEKKPVEEQKKPLEEEKKPVEEEESPGGEKEGLPKELEGFCTIGSLRCSAFTKEALEEAGPAPHQERCAVPEGPWELRGKDDIIYDRERAVYMKDLRKPYLKRPDLWTPEFKAAYKKAGNTWPSAEGQAWEIHHKKPLDFGGTNVLENLVPLERSVHMNITKYWARLKRAMAKPFGGFRSPRWKNIRAGEEDVEL